MQYSEFLLGKKNNYNFSNLLIGSNRLKDKDKDGVPNIFDCEPNNPKKHGKWQDSFKEWKAKLPGATQTPPPATTTTTPSKTLPEVLKPPTTALTPSLPQPTPTSGSLAVSKPSGGGGGGGSQPQTTISTPTPSAETLTGTAQQKEEQIKQFQKEIAVQQLTPQQRAFKEFQSEQKQSLIPSISNTEYSNLVRQKYQEELSKQQVTTGWSLAKAGSYSKSGELYVSKTWMPLQDYIKIHETGHKLDFSDKDIKDYSKYKEASKNAVPDILENIGYKKENIAQEYYARAFTNYIQDPDKFKKNYPEIAKEFEKKLNVDTTPKTQTGELFGFSGQILSDKQYAKAELLTKVESNIQKKSIAPPEQYGVYGKYLGKPPQPESIKQALPPAYSQVTSIPYQTKTQETVSKVTSSIPYRVLAGDIGEKFTGINLSPLGVNLKPTPTITLRQIKEEAERRNIYGSSFIPTTPLGVSAFVGTPSAFSYLQGAGRVGYAAVKGTEAYFGVTGIKGALSSDLSTRERIESGTIGVLSFAGLGARRTMPKGKIQEAINLAEIETRPKGYVKESFLDKFEIPENKKIEIKRLLDEGYAIRKSEVSLKPQIGYEKYTPEVKGTILEIVSSKGDVAQRISLGEVTATLNKKTISKDILAESILKLNKEGNVQAYTEQIERTKKTPLLGIESGKKYPEDKFTLSKFYEESKQIGMLEQEKKRAFITDTTTNLISKEKYKGQPLMKEFGTLKKEITLEPPENTISVYHATKSKNIPSIKEKGLIPSKEAGIHGVVGESDKVFTAISRKTAEGYKVMLGENAEIIKINVPKESFFEAVKKEGGVGTIGQVKFDRVPPEWIDQKRTKTVSTFITPEFDYLKSQSKPMSKTRIFELQELKKTEGIKIQKEDKGLLLGRRFYESTGKTITKNIQETPKVKKPMKPFKFDTEEIIKTEYKQPKIEKEVKSQVLEQPTPSYVGGEGGELSQSVFYGKGMFRGFVEELPSQFGATKPMEILSKGLSKSGEIGVKTGVRSSFSISSSQPSSLIGVSLTKDITKEKTIDVTKDLTKEKTGEVSINNFITGQDTGLVQIQKPSQQLVQEQPQRLKTTPRITTPARTGTFIFPEEIIPFRTIRKLDEEKPRKKKKKKYIAELRRKGKFIEVSKPTELSTAIGVGIEKVKSTLGASFRLVEEGSKRVVPLNFSTPEFRRAKKEEGVIVQRQKFRLSSPYEKKEIFGARIKAKRNSFGF